MRAAKALTVCWIEGCTAVGQLLDVVGEQPMLGRSPGAAAYRGAVRLYEREIPGALPLQWHFFQAIQDSQWLPHLLERKLAGEPLTVIDGAGTNGFREWPIGHYLLHVAKGNDRVAHLLVVEAIRRVASSRHPDVRQQGQEIAAALTPDISVGLADVVVGWLDPDDQNFYQIAPHAYLKRLAEAGFSAEAVLVAGAVFQVFDRAGRIASLHPDGMYEHHLLDAVKVLAPTAGLAALDLFSNLLIRCETIAQRYGADANDDYTYITPHPLSDNQMATYGVTEGLTISVRDTALAICRQGPGNVEAVVTQLLGYGPKLFKRIALHVASKYTSASVSAAMAAFRAEHQDALLDQSPVPKSAQADYRAWTKRFAQWLYGTKHIAIQYGIEYDGTDIRKLSPGTRGIVLLLLYLALDDADDRPLIIDQPEENLDPKSVFDELVGLFIRAKSKRQVIMVTHNANLVVNTDADQIIIAEAARISLESYHQ
jgi:hypothetical protein